MNLMKKEKVKILLEQIALRLAKLNFKASKYDDKAFVCEINSESLGVIYITILQLDGPQVLNVVPSVGVRNYKVESILSSIVGIREFENIVTTVSSSIDKLSPFIPSCPWEFRTYEEIIKGANRIISYIERYGIKYIKNNATLAGLCKTLGKGHSHILSEYRMPIIYYLMGKNDLAKKFITNELNKLKGRNDLYAQDYTKFANEFMRQIVESERRDL